MTIYQCNYAQKHSQKSWQHSEKFWLQAWVLCPHCLPSGYATALNRYIFCILWLMCEVFVLRWHVCRVQTGASQRHCHAGLTMTGLTETSLYCWIPPSLPWHFWLDMKSIQPSAVPEYFFVNIWNFGGRQPAIKQAWKITKTDAYVCDIVAVQGVAKKQAPTKISLFSE